MNPAESDTTDGLREEILNANIKEHSKEARYYNAIHTELFNRFEQARCRRGLRACTNGLDRKARCLDVGAGTGNITSKLLALDFTDITCVDISAEMLEELKAATGVPAAKTVTSDVDSFLDNCTDRYALITMSSVLHHLPDYATTLRRLLGRLEPNGVLFITHEPRPRQDRPDAFRGSLTWLIRKLEFALYAARYLLLILSGRLRYLSRDCRFSDYHTGARSPDVRAIRAICPGMDVQYLEYATGRFSLTAALLNRLTADSFQMTIRKTPSRIRT